VVNIVSGHSSELVKVLAEHNDVDAIWTFTGEANAVIAKASSAGNLKQVFSDEGRAIDWFSVEQGEGRWFLQHATQVKKHLGTLRGVKDAAPRCTARQNHKERCETGMRSYV